MTIDLGDGIAVRLALFISAAAVAMTGFLLGPAAGIGVLAFATLAGVSLLRPMFAVALYAAIVVSNAAAVATDQYGLPPVGGLMVPALAALLLLRALSGLEDLRIAVAILPVAVLYIALHATSLFFVTNPGPTVAALLELAKNALIVLVFAGFVTRWTRLRAVVITVALTVGAMALLSVFQYASGTFDNSYLGFANLSIKQIAGEVESFRLSGPLPDPNFYGQLLVLALPLALGVAITERVGLRVVAAAASAAMAVAVVLTYSRGAVLALMVVAAFAILMSRHRVLMIAVVAGLSLAMLVLVPGSAIERLGLAFQAAHALLEGSQAVADPALAQRLSVTRAALTMIAEAPFTGVGAGQFATTFPGFAVSHGLDPGAPPQAHSLFLELTAEGGFIVLAAFAALMAVVFWLALRTVRRLAGAGRRRDAILTLSLILSLVGFLATSVFLHADYARLFWMVLSFLVAAIAIEQPPRSGYPPLNMSRRTLMTPVSAILKNVLLCFWRGKLVIVAVTALGLLAGWYQATTTPREYESGQDILFRFGRDYFPISPGEARRNWGENVIVSLDAALFTEMRLLTGHQQFEATVRELGPKILSSDPASSPTSNEMLPADVNRIAAEIADRFDVRRVEGAALVSVRARHPMPEIADALAEQHVSGFLARRAALLNPDAGAFFDDQMAAAEAERAALVAQKADVRPGAQKSDDPSVEAQGTGAETPDSGASAQPETASLDARIVAGTENLAALERERQNWSLARDFRQSVAPVAAVVDRRPAAGNLVGLSPLARLVLSGVLGFLVGSMLVLGLGLMSDRILSPQPPAA